uniref:Uncharacterized protein n=1 Tax=Lepeophtheirus salmonis TaxID=72036 RepID=A0A0K2UR25_LEPSM
MGWNSVGGIKIYSYQFR